MANSQDTLVSRLDELDSRFSAVVEQMNDPSVASVPARITSLAKEHDSLRLNIPTIRGDLDQTEFHLKFVLEKPTDIQEIKDVLDRLGQPCSPEDVLLMPQAIDRRQLARRSAWVAELCKQHGYRFCSRLQISLYGNQPST